MDELDDEIDIEVASISESEAEMARGADAAGSSGTDAAVVSVDRMHFLEEQLKELQQQLAEMHKPASAPAQPAAPVADAAGDLADLAAGLDSLMASAPAPAPAPAPSTPPPNRPDMVAVLAGVSSAKSGLRRARRAPAESEPQPTGLAGMLQRTMTKRFATLHGQGDDASSCASSVSFGSPGADAAPSVPPRSRAQAAITSPLAVTGVSPVVGSAESAGSSGSMRSRRSIVSSGARRRLSAGSVESRRSSIPSSAVPLPRAMAMPAPSASTDTAPPARRVPPALLGAIKEAGGTKSLKQAAEAPTPATPKQGLLGAIQGFKKGKLRKTAPKPDTAAPGPKVGGLLGDIQGFKKGKLRKAASGKYRRPASGPISAAALGSAAGRLNKTGASGTPKPKFSNPMAAQLAGVQLKRTGRTLA